MPNNTALAENLYKQVTNKNPINDFCVAGKYLGCWICHFPFFTLTPDEAVHSISDLWKN